MFVGLVGTSMGQMGVSKTVGLYCQDPPEIDPQFIETAISWQLNTKGALGDRIDRPVSRPFKGAPVGI